MNLQKILGDIRKADLDYGLIQDGDRIGVGVSGGKDSMVLLTALHMYSKFKGKTLRLLVFISSLVFLIWTFRKS